MDKKIIYFYNSDFCPFCNKFKNLIKYLNCENMFKEINMTKLNFDKKIILTEDTQIYTPVFFYYENGNKILINNDLLLKKLSENFNIDKNKII